MTMRSTPPPSAGVDGGRHPQFGPQTLHRGVDLDESEGLPARCEHRRDIGMGRAAERGDEADPQGNFGKPTPPVCLEQPLVGEAGQEGIALGGELAERERGVDGRHPQLHPTLGWVEVDDTLDADPHPVGRHADRVAVPFEETVDPVAILPEQHHRDRRGGQLAGSFVRLDEIEVDVAVSSSRDPADLPLDPDPVGHRLFERGPHDNAELADGVGPFVHHGDGSSPV